MLMNGQEINLGNWNFSHYFTGPLKAMVSCGVDHHEKINEQTMVYWVSVIKDEFTEVYQSEFQVLGEAINFINQKYGHWSFKDTTQLDAGCGSCSNKD